VRAPGHLPRRSEILVADGRVFNAQRTPIPGVGQAIVMQEITHLKELDRIKSEFVTTVSHDLRSPLTAILGYVEVSDTHDAEDKMFRYVPTGMQLAPFISYKRYEGLPITPPEPLVVASPRVDGTSGLEEPGKYAALLNLPGRMDALRVVENQTLEGYLVIAIANDGAIVTSRQRVLVLLTPK
jgi:signal transduction histidine kinase